MKEKKLRFYEKAHTYWLGRRKLDSVTTFIGRFFEEFDEKGIARKLAKFPVNRAQKRGVRYWLGEWKKSREFGTKVHSEIEIILKTKIPIDGMEEHTRQGIKWARNKIPNINRTTVSTEKRVYDEELGLAGTIDLLVINDNGSIFLVDWKTNKKLSREGYKGKTGILPPTEKIQDCHISKYGLQLSLYAYILERRGYKIDKLYIVHLSKEGAKEIEVAYLKSKVEEMLVHDDRINFSDSDSMGGT